MEERGPIIPFSPTPLWISDFPKEKEELMKVRKSVIALFLLPAGLFYLAFILIPAIWAFYFSAFDWSGFTSSMKFVGLGNYTQLFSDHLFWMSLGNTLIILLPGGGIIFLLTFLLTVLINSGVRGKKFFRAMIFLPNVIATVALATLWAFIYNPSFGLLNSFFKLIGVQQLSQFTWTSADRIFYAALVAIIWINVGFQLVLIMAGVDKIPFEFFEAAKIEGASQFQMFTRITIPMIWDVITVAFVLWSISALKTFEFLYAFGNPSIPPTLYTIGIYLYVMGFGKRDPIYRLGYATAIGVLLLISVVIIVALIRRLTRRESLSY
jgi:ABC-type sugar transport system permease subunit